MSGTILRDDFDRYHDYGCLIKSRDGITLWHSENNTIKDNNASSNSVFGIRIVESDWNQIIG